MIFRMWRLRLGRVFLIWMALHAFMYACTPALPFQPGKEALTYKAEVDLRFNGFRRTYLIHLPPGYDAGRPLPLVVVVHGAFDTAEGMERFSGFSDLADQENFIALYPNGIGILGYLQHWNAGHCCGKAAADQWDDVGYLAMVIEDVCSRLAIDRRRIYMTGFSNGGMMTYRFGAERGDLLAAIAPLAATAGGRPDGESPEWRIPEPIKPLPLLSIHGLSDDYVPFNGGTSPARGTEREYWPVKRSLGIWIQRNQCRSNPTTIEQPGGKVQVDTWDDCRQGNDIVLYTLDGWGHLWPGPYFNAELAPGDPLKNFDAARIIWDFFKTKKNVIDSRFELR